MRNLGINTVYVNIEDMQSMGLERVEMCLGRQSTYADRLEKMESDIVLANTLNMPFSIHLPMYTFDWFDGDYLDAYFLDTDIEKRNMSYRLLEENLKRVALLKPDYCVIHFSGLYSRSEQPYGNFEKVVVQALKRINDLAREYKVKVLVEYIGSNARFSDFREWIRLTQPLPCVGLITDTGHLYFASRIYGFDFDEALEMLSAKSDAFHIWTTKGDGVYGHSEYYKTYHHIVPHEEQKKENGWAFDTAEVFKKLIQTGKPVIVEASTLYKGCRYFLQGIRTLVQIANKKDSIMSEE